jgi:sulfate transport system permease protein
MPRRTRVIPGFALSLGYTVFYLSLIVLLPLAALFARSATLGWSTFWSTITSDWTLSATRFTLGTSFVAAALNVVFGFLVVWVLARYTFPGRRAVDALIDLPFALRTAVAGIALTALYSDRGWMGAFRAKIGYPWPTWRGFTESWWPVEFTTYSQIALAPPSASSSPSPSSASLSSSAPSSPSSET